MFQQNFHLGCFKGKMTIKYQLKVGVILMALFCAVKAQGQTIDSLPAKPTYSEVEYRPIRAKALIFIKDKLFHHKSSETVLVPFH